MVGFEENRRVEENDLSCRDDHAKKGLMMLDVVKFHLMMNDVHFVFLRTLKPSVGSRVSDSSSSDNSSLLGHETIQLILLSTC